MSGMLDGEFVAYGDDVLVEAVARQGGPAGVCRGSLLGGALDVEVDAADPSQIVCVRAWLDGSLSDAQVGALELLLGHNAEAVVRAVGQETPRRFGSRSRQNTSLNSGDVPIDLTAMVLAADSLTRAETPQGARSVLRLEAYVKARRLGLVIDIEPVDDQELALAVVGVPVGGRGYVAALLHDAREFGILPDATAALLLDTLYKFEDSVVSPMYLEQDALFSRQPTHLSSAPAELRLASSSLDLTLQVARLSVAPYSAFKTAVSCSFVDRHNVVVRVRGAGVETPSGWWVRARRVTDSVVVSVVPLQADGNDLTGFMLVPAGEDLLVDVADSPTQRAFSSAAVMTEDAYRLGRLAARFERLGDDARADVEWRSCARAHGAAGDDQREKMALGRGYMRRGTNEPVLADHLLNT